MNHFTVREFNNYTKMDPKLVYALDKYRELLKAPVFLSPAPGAQWRDDDSQSYHNIRKYGQSKACDIFPTANLWISFLTALQIPEIKGIGIYPYWHFNKLNYGMHLDVRDSSTKVIWWRDKEEEYHSLWNTADIVNFVTQTAQRLQIT